jgi:transposase
MPKPFPEEFRRDVVAVARKGDSTLRQVAVDFAIFESCLHRWINAATDRRASFHGDRSSCGDGKPWLDVRRR